MPSRHIKYFVCCCPGDGKSAESGRRCQGSRSPDKRPQHVSSQTYVIPPPPAPRHQDHMHLHRLGYACLTDFMPSYT
jgi:hypothetical protein